jgi:hypothetical protein
MNDQELRNRFHEAYDGDLPPDRLDQTLTALPERSRISLLLSYPARRWHLSRLATQGFVVGLPALAALGLVLAIATGNLGQHSSPAGTGRGGWTGYSPAPGGPLTGVPQDITFSGAVTGHWSEATVTQCEVQAPAGAGAADVPVYHAFLKAPLNGASYVLTIGLIGYHGPGTYQGVPATIPTLPRGAAPASPHPSPIVGPVQQGQTWVSIAALFVGVPTQANALYEVDDPTASVITVKVGDAGGTIDGFFARWQPNQLPPPSPPPASARIHVAGSWSCGAFPIAPQRVSSSLGASASTPRRASPSPR